MPINRTYKSGSIVYFDKDKAEHVYVLQQGMVALLSTSPENKELREDIQPGEFFGVKSALGRFPREETAQVLTDATVMVLSTQEFEALAIKNHKLVMKMLKVFSNQLRRIGKEIQDLLGSNDGEEQPGDGLFRIGEYYLKNKKFDQALYAYDKYLLYYPNGRFSAPCQQRMEMARSGAETGYAIASDGTSFVETAGQAAPAPAAAPSGGGSRTMDAVKQYYEAFALYSQGKVADALRLYKQVLGAEGLSPDIAEKAVFDAARCQISLGKHQEAIAAFTDLLRQYPSSPSMKEALLLIGKSYAALGDADKARGFLGKVANMPPRDALNRKAQLALEELGG
jgi:tetratricopeptide (TPR) repeat protein